MSEVSVDAGRKAAVESKRRGAKTPGGAKRAGEKSQRLQLHLGETVCKRLAVHAALMGRNQSREAERILMRFLAREGRGRELFGEPAGDVDPDAE